MKIEKPLNIPGRRKVLTKNLILKAQENTNSAAEASRWLSVSYNTYKKWAQYYNIFEQHKNQEGVGIKKGWASYKVSLEEIFNGRSLPKRYSLSTLKNRLIEEGYALEECSNCGYNEVNMVTGRVCLSLDFIDGDKENKKLDNIRLLCPNCYLSFNGSFSKSKSFCK
tara:strand:- start:532 stop:1032 length:501 start_codon:yes stop_codon:yes gene_type:complete